MLDPDVAEGRMPAFSNNFNTPMWLSPRAAPPPRAIPSARPDPALNDAVHAGSLPALTWATQPSPVSYVHTKYSTLTPGNIRFTTFIIEAFT